VNLGPDTLLCTGNSIKLSAGPDFAGYLWNDKSTDSTLMVNTSGTYFVQVSDNCGGKATDTIHIHPAIGTLPANFLPADTIVCSNTGALIQSQTEFVKYNWSTGETNRSILVKTAGEYILQVVDQEGCKGSDSIRISFKDCEALLLFPNAFTPNHDGLNDVFRLKYPGHVSDYNLLIFDRWGQKIFETSDPSAGWDGDFNGQHQPEATYVWIVHYTDNAGKKQNLTGSVVLIR
jgi:gliding motility-associated-like protein